MKLKIFLVILSGFLLSSCGRKPSDEPVQVVVKPKFFQLPPGGQVQFSAEVSGTLDKSVQWEVNGAGSSISTTGLYQAPGIVTAEPAKIQARSVADPTAVGNGSSQNTQVQKLPGEVLLSDMNQLVIGGYTVRAGITIDLNGDNILDLIAPSTSTDKVRFFLGVGTAGKFNHQDIPITAPVAVAVADFIPEGSDAFAADAAIACAGPCKLATDPPTTSSSNIVLVQGKLQGVYTVTYANGLDLTNLGPAVLLAAGRFHGDVQARNSDLVAVTANGSLVLFLQNKQVPVTFSPMTPIQVGKPVQLVVADFNQDSFLDLAIVRESVSDVLVLLGDGAGSFPTQISVPMPAQPISIGAGDFNGDDIPDLAAAFSSLKSVSFSIGKGDGTFQSPTSITLSSPPDKLVVEDINLDRVVKTPQVKGNSKHDIAVSLPNEREIYVLFGDGDGSMIGTWIYKTDVAPVSLLSGFFSGPNSPSGFQSVGLAYINQTDGKFYIINNANF